MTTQTVRDLPITAIDVISNPRKRFDDVKLQALAASIDENGLIQPILVRERTAHEKIEANGREFELVAGERRLRAHLLLGRDRIRSTIREMDERQAARIRLVENLHREDLHEMDEAQAFQQLLEDEAYTVPMLAAECGRSESYVYQRLKLLELCDEARGAFAGGEIPAAHAIAIARLKPDDQEKALEYAQGGEWRGQPSTAQLQSFIAREVLLELKNAPFDPEDAELVPEAGSCAACPKRTGNAPGLWPELEGDDRCTDRSCFESKVDKALRAAVDAGCIAVCNSWENPPKPFRGALTSWRELYRKTDRCAQKERAIFVVGNRRGERIWICRDNSCAKHGRSKSALSADEKKRRTEESERIRRRREVATLLEERIIERVALPEADAGGYLLEADQARLLARLLFRNRNRGEQQKILKSIDVEPVERERETEWGTRTETDCHGPLAAALEEMSLREVWSLTWRIALMDVVDRARMTYGTAEWAMAPLEDLAGAVGYQPHNAWRSVRAAAEVELPEDSE